MASQGDRCEPKVVSTTVLASTRWLRLEALRYIDESGVERPWDAAARTTGTPGHADAVEVCAISRSRCSESPPSVLVVKQFRPPIDAFSIEFPAGLVDPGEAPEAAALRELKEETGFIGVVTSVSPQLSYDPGMCRGTMHLVTVKIDLDDDANANPQPTPEDGEFIEVLWLPLTELRPRLTAMAAEPRTVVDGKLFTFAAGIGA